MVRKDNGGEGEGDETTSFRVVGRAVTMRPEGGCLEFCVVKRNVLLLLFSSVIFPLRNFPQTNGACDASWLLFLLLKPPTLTLLSYSYPTYQRAQQLTHSPVDRWTTFMAHKTTLPPPLYLPSGSVAFLTPHHFPSCASHGCRCSVWPEATRSWR